MRRLPWKMATLAGVLLMGVACQQSPPPDGRSEALHALFDKEWEFRIQQSPLFATTVGRMEANDELPSFSLAAEKERYEFNKALLADLDKIDVASLDEADMVNYEVFRLGVVRSVEQYESGGYLMPVNSDSGFHAYFPRFGERVPLATAKDYENYIARMRAWPRAVDEQIEVLREGLKQGFTPPAVTMQGYEGTISAHVVENPQDSAFFKPFTNFPATIAEPERERLTEAGETAIRDAVVPGYRKLLTFFTEEYLPGCRKTLGALDLPNGKTFYDQEVKFYTTLDVTADEVHEIGLREVARIRGEMEALIKETGFKGTFAEFLKFLRTDPRFYAKTPEELLRRAAWIAKRMDGKLPSLFGRLPRQPYTVEPVPDSLAPKYTGGRYVEAPPGGTKAGIYWVNTYALDTRPFYTQEALTLHEAVPGHHLQIALAGEMEGLPEFRKHEYFSAFGEGWGLYAERLGLEAGFYNNPYSNFGRLTYEMWRACRLVVDTGVHAKGWTRQQMIDYLAGNTALSLHECTTETDRYISWPGQALAYKMGELKIRELRALAEKELGAKFDLRDFHDEVLKNGAVPLGTLERQIKRYIERAKQ